MADHGSAGKKKTVAHSPEDSHDVEILEKGEIFFFYRPKVEMEHPTSIDDVQRMYMVIKPEAGGTAEQETKQSHKSGKESVMAANKNVDDDKKPSVEDDKEGGKNAKDHGGASKEETKHHEQEHKSAPSKKAEKGRHVGENARDHGGASKEETKHDEQEHKSALSKKAEKGRHGGEGEEKVNIAKQDLCRFIVLGRKSLPDASKRTRPYWGFVDLVTTNMDDIKKALGPEEYDTATRGKRHKPAARAAGEGVCCILRHKKGNQSHTHLIYKLELPKAEAPNSPQSALNIEEEGSFIIQVKNPNQSSPANAGIGNKRKATYPAHLQGKMGHYRFVSVDPCDYLNYEGCEFILISASDDVEKELGIHLDVQHDEACSPLLSLLGREFPLHVKPLLEGEWA